jgi:hypothetical protein
MHLEMYVQVEYVHHYYLQEMILGIAEHHWIMIVVKRARYQSDQNERTVW